MAAAQIKAVLRHIRKLTNDPHTSEQTDGALLRAFLDRNDQAAFESLVKRHGPMVLRVCLHSLGQPEDAEDAFQATFLVLARQGASIRKKESLASWLHGVAHHMATHAKRAAARRRGHESRVSPTQPRDPALTAACRELQTLLTEEIERLPETLREPFVACCLEIKGCAEVAQQLGLEQATVRKRLSRARKLLQERLTRRGVALTAALAATAVGTTSASALPPSLVASTVRAATQLAVGQAAAGLISTQVSALAGGVLRTMFLTRLKTAVKTAAAVLLAVVLAGPGVGILTYRTLVAGQPGEAPATPTREAPPASDGAQLAKLIDQLGSDSFAEREKATEELDQIGVPALDALRKAIRDDDPERKRRAEALVQKIENRVLEANLLAPKRVHLVFKDTPLAEAVADFKRQSGYELTLSDPEGKLKGRTVTLDTGDVTFWQALDQFCRKAGLIEATPLPASATSPAPYPPGPGRRPINNQKPEVGRPGGAAGESDISLSDGKALTLPTDDRTAVRVRAELARMSEDREILVPLKITSEPKLRRLQIVAINITKATDNQGQSLEPVALGREPVVNRPLVAGFPAPRSQQSGANPARVRLKTGAKSSGALSELSGTITARGVLEAQPDGKSVTFDIPFTLKDVPLP